MRIVIAFAFAVILMCVGTLPSNAQKRAALVIGNAAYRSMPTLTTPKNDAEDVGASLRGLGFDTIVATDLDWRSMNEVLDRFSRMIANAEIVIVYYSGHGLQFEGNNYLLPVDASLGSADDVTRFRLVELDDIMEVLRKAPKARVIVLDACRSDPKEEELKRKLASKERDALPTRGLARITAGVGQIVAYATQPNEVAADGSGRNSPFTAAFLHNVGTPGIDMRTMFHNVLDEVARATGGRQRPELLINLDGKYELKPEFAPGSAPASGTASGPTEAERAWVLTQNTTSTAVLEEFIRRFGDSYYSALARARLEELKKDQVGMIAAPQQAVPASPVEPAVGTSPEREHALKPQDSFKDCDKCPEMVVVPAGTFMMGSPTNEEGRENDEGPVHSVTIEKPFAVGRFAVTFDEWDACVSDGGCEGYKPKDQWGRGSQPVINVSWYDADNYVKWLSKKTGKTYRLLSEAEWEYAARAGTTTPFWWGSSISTRQGNYNGTITYGGGPKGEWIGETVAVDSFEPNMFGLYQVHGNIGEWVEDCYHDNYKGVPTNGSAWVAGACKDRVVRGGSWGSVPGSLRSASRQKANRPSRAPTRGFRVARALP
jgi:formylglycine-generating enzyme required for sulfatase activity